MIRHRRMKNSPFGPTERSAGWYGSAWSSSFQSTLLIRNCV